MILFEKPIKTKKVRKDVIAYQFKNGTIVINNKQYLQYSFTEAISRFRKQYPAYRKAQ